MSVDVSPRLLWSGGRVALVTMDIPRQDCEWRDSKNLIRSDSSRNCAAVVALDFKYRTEGFGVQDVLPYLPLSNGGTGLPADRHGCDMQRGAMAKVRT